MDVRVLAFSAAVRRAGSAWICADGRCMRPLLLSGDKVRVVPCRKLSRGHLYCVILPNGQVAVHRLIGTCGNGYLFKGDRSGRFDLLGADRVIGLVDQVAPRGDKSRVRPLRKLPDTLIVDSALWVFERDGVYLSRRGNAFRYALTVFNLFVRFGWCLRDLR
jgi:hypothetical protein